MGDSGLPAGVGRYDEDRPVKAFAIWRSSGQDASAHGMNFALSVFVYRPADGVAVVHPLSDPESEEARTADVQGLWTKTWGSLEYATPGHQFTIYDFFTADSVDLAVSYVQGRIEDIKNVGMFPGEPVHFTIPDPPESADWESGSSPRPVVSEGRMSGRQSAGGSSAADVQAAVWAVAAALAGRLGPRYQFQEAHPGGGQADTLAFAEPAGEGPHIYVGLGSSIHISTAERHEIPIEGNVWPALVSGRMSIRQVADQVMSFVPDQRGVVPVAEGVRFLADVARDAALLARAWRIEAGWCDTSGEESFYRKELYGSFDLSAPEDGASGQDGMWFVLAGDDPLLCVDVDHRRVLAKSWTGWLTFDDARPEVAKMMRESADKGSPTSLGLPVLLSKFNRKERFFVVVDAVGGDIEELHEPSLRLTDAFRSRLEEAIGVPVPAHAWATVDYHLNWLHAGLQWKAGAHRPYQDEILSRRANGAVELVSGNQEDVDLIVAWTADDDTPYVVFIEAKAFGSWTNKQMGHKVPRLSAIVEHARGAGLDFTPVLVLSSPRRPSKLDAAKWPAWALSPDGNPRYMSLRTAGPRLGVERCDTNGKASAAGTSWQFNDG